MLLASCLGSSPQTNPCAQSSHSAVNCRLAHCAPVGHPNYHHMSLFSIPGTPHALAFSRRFPPSTLSFRFGFGNVLLGAFFCSPRQETQVLLWVPQQLASITEELGTDPRLLIVLFTEQVCRQAGRQPQLPGTPSLPWLTCSPPHTSVVRLLPL